MSQQPPAKSNTARFVLVVTLLVILGVVGWFAWKRGWLGLSGTTSESPYETPPLNADYLPHDTSAVLHVNWREAQDSKYVSKELDPLLRQFNTDFAPEDIQQALGVDMKKDVDWIQLAVIDDDTPHPLVLMSGRFDPAKFKTSDKGLRQVNKPGDRYQVYELPDPKNKRTFTLTSSDKLLLLCEKPSRVTDALADVAEGRLPVLDDAKLAELLKQVNRDQTLWGAASLKQLRALALPAKYKEAGTAFGLILRNANAVYGGIKCGDNVQGDVFFLSNSEQEAMEVENNVSRLCTFAAGAKIAAFLIKIPPEVMPLLKFLGTGKVSRNGTTVILHCGLP